MSSNSNSNLRVRMRSESLFNYNHLYNIAQIAPRCKRATPLPKANKDNRTRMKLRRLIRLRWIRSLMILHNHLLHLVSVSV